MNIIYNIIKIIYYIVTTILIFFGFILIVAWPETNDPNFWWYLFISKAVGGISLFFAWVFVSSNPQLFGMDDDYID